MLGIGGSKLASYVGVSVAALLVASALLPLASALAVGVSANGAAPSGALGSGSASPRQPDVAVPGSAPSVGNGNDWYADAPSGTVIGVVTGSFPAEAGITSEVSAVGPGGGPACPVGTANCYGLQINTNPFPTTYPTTGGPISTNGSEQFVYQDSGTSAFMGIWVILFGFTTCPSPSPSGYSSWNLQGGNCYAHSPFVSVPPVPVTDLSAVTMTAYANQSANDAIDFCVNPAISGWPVCTPTSASDAIGLSQAWTVAEFNVFGDNGGSQAAFNAGAALQVQTQIATEGGGALAPSCAGAPGVHTVEDNNLYLWPCGASSTGILFWEANESFGLSATPASATFQAGQPATYSVGFTSFAGTPAPVQLTVVSSLPPGVTQSFPVTVTPPSSGTLSLTTSPTTPLGDYTFTVQSQIAGLGGGPIATTAVSLHIFNFTVSISPGTQTVLRGVTADYAVQLSLVPGSTLVSVPPIVLSDPGLPADSSLSGFNPAGYVLSSPVPTTVPFAVLTAPAPSGSLGDFLFSVSGTAQGYPSGAASAVAALHIYDYAVAVIPSGQTVLRGGDPALYYLDLTLVPGSSTFGVPAELLSVTGLPSGTPPPVFSVPVVTPALGGCTPPLCPTLTVATEPPPSGPLGDSTVTVTGTDPVNGGYRSSTAGLHIFDFVSAPTPSESLFQGETITVRVSLPLDSGSTTVGLPSVSLALTGLPSGVVALGFPSSLVAGGSQTFTLETASVGSYVSCPQVSNHGGQNLQGADLAHCILAGYDLRGDNLKGANLSGANLSNADLAGTNLKGANLSSANTSGADFQGANMQGVDLTAAGPVGTFTLTVTATVDGGLRLGYSTLTLWGDQLSGDDFHGANLQDADLAGDLAVGANFGGDNLQHANLGGIDLQGADLKGANLQYADLAAADLQGGDFQGDNLRNADLAGATLTGLGPLTSQLTDFNGANLLGANLTGAVCGTPNYITAIGANTNRIVGVPSTCNPPLDPPAGAAVAVLPVPNAGLPTADWLVLLTAMALGALLGTTRLRRKRPPTARPGLPKFRSGASPTARVSSGRSEPVGSVPNGSRRYLSTYEDAIRRERELYWSRPGGGFPPMEI
jgi:uncharacterized protein YjbI with pentapeptide repeats